MGIYIGKKYQGKGFGTDVMVAFLDYLFKEGFRVIKLDTSTENKIAVNLYKKLGFEVIKVVKNDRNILVKKGDQWVSKKSDTVFFKITKKQFNSLFYNY